jgi:hypothetical protein
VYIELNVELIDGIFVDGIFEQKFINNFRPINQEQPEKMQH